MKNLQKPGGIGQKTYKEQTKLRRNVLCKGGTEEKPRQGAEFKLKEENQSKLVALFFGATKAGVAIAVRLRTKMSKSPLTESE